MKIFWLAPRFSQPERLWNRECIKSLRDRGCEVISPQEWERDLAAIAGNLTSKGVLRVEAESDLFEMSMEALFSSDVVVAAIDGTSYGDETTEGVRKRIDDRQRNDRPTHMIIIYTDCTGTSAALGHFEELVHGTEVVLFPRKVMDERLGKLCETIYDMAQKLVANCLVA